MHVLVEKRTIENNFPVKVAFNRFNTDCLIGESFETITVTFILGAVAGGLFSEIGKDLWAHCKTLSSKLWELLKNAGERKSKIKYIESYEVEEVKIYVETEHKGHKIVASLNSGRTPDFEELALFWDEVNTQISYIINQIDKKPNKYKKTMGFRISLNFQKRRWDLTKTDDPEKPSWII